MSDDFEITRLGVELRGTGQQPIPFPELRSKAGKRSRADRRNGRNKPRMHKLRFTLVLVGLAGLAFISMVFGVMMSVTSDLPQLENSHLFPQFQKSTENSYMYDDQGHLIGLFAPPTHEVIDQFQEISPWMRRAIVSVEDKRFWTDPGVDIRGIARALMADVTGGATQGASTIAQQFVKNALQESDNRTVFEKLREAALAYQLTRRWPRWKILQEYMNSIYFGNGAYGVESAARVYFGKQLGFDAVSAAGHSTCGEPGSLPCAELLQPYQAALLAGMVANPSAFDPLSHPGAARERRELVLKDMLAQHYITRAEYRNQDAQPLPTATDLQQPQEPPAAPYFTSWLRPQILRAMGYGKRGVSNSVALYRAYYGGLTIRTTLDLSMQQAAEQAIAQDLPSGPGEPTASLVAIDNATGQVRAMVGGPVEADSAGGVEENYGDHQFNLATEAERQPGSAFKPFTLAVALESGFGPDSVFLSAPANFVVPNSGGKEIFHVRNFGNNYSGDITLQEATDISDNSVFTRLGIDGLGPTGTKRIAAMAHKMGIRTPVSTNPAMIIGGLKVGVSPLDMAHAYETLATGGNRVYDPVLGDAHEGPTGIEQISCPSVCGSSKTLTDHPQYKRVMPQSIADGVGQMLTGVVQSGTAQSAAIGGVDVAGKTGTTTNYVDAWFIGWTPQMTTAVWVGFPQGAVPMLTNYNGEPVDGGTYPAIIWHDFMVQALQIMTDEQASKHTSSTATTNTVDASPATNTAVSSSSSSSSSSTTGTGPAGANGNANGNTNGNGGGTTGNGGGTTGGGGGGGTTGGGGGGGTTGGGGGTTGGGGGGGGGTTGGGGGTTGGGGGGGGGSGGGSGGAGIGGGG